VSAPPVADSWPLVDHHVHGVVREELDRPAFELLISESGVSPGLGRSHFDSPIGLAIRRWCAPLLDLEGHAEAERYLERRAQLGAGEVNRRLLSAAGLELLLVDTGHRAGEVLDPAEMGRLAGAPAGEVARVERIADLVAERCSSPGEFVPAFGEALETAARSAVGLKTIVAYRCGFELEPTVPDRMELLLALDGWFAGSLPGRFRVSSPVVLRQVLWIAAEVAREHSLPLQVHAGFGDTDLVLHRADPVVFTDWVRVLGDAGVTVAFLHCYPYHRQAGYLAAVFPHVYYDVGCALNYTGASAGTVLAEAMELAPFHKQLYSSDAFGLPELVYLGALLFRRHVQRILQGWVADDDCTQADAERIREMVSAGNAMRIYPAGRVKPGG
jgi:predicted TIM-barrel fold metal-dependent hydrolase